MAVLTDTVKAFLNEPRFAVVATMNEDTTPQLSVVWYELAGDSITFSTSAGNRKHRNLQRDSRLTVCVEDGYRYVTLRGTATFEDDPAVVSADVQRQAVRYMGAEAGPAMAERINADPHVLVRATIAHVTAFGFEAHGG